MDETNKTLALLLVAAIVVSLGGTIISLNKLEGSSITDITGLAVNTSSGTISLSVADDTSIAFTTTLLDFGSGYVNGSCNNCTMWTNSTAAGTNYSDSTCCLGTEWPILDVESGLWIENQGNTNLSVQLNFSKTPAEFIGGSSPAAEAQFHLMTDNTAGACLGDACGGAGSPTHNDGSPSCSGNLQYTSGWWDFNTSNPYICGSAGVEDLKPDNDIDEIVMDIRVLVPLNSPTTGKSVTTTVTGTSP